MISGGFKTSILGAVGATGCPGGVIVWGSKPPGASGGVTVGAATSVGVVGCGASTLTLTGETAATFIFDNGFICPGAVTFTSGALGTVGIGTSISGGAPN